MWECVWCKDRIKRIADHVWWELAGFCVLVWWRHLLHLFHSHLLIDLDFILRSGSCFRLAGFDIKQTHEQVQDAAGKANLLKTQGFFLERLMKFSEKLKVSPTWVGVNCGKTSKKACNYYSVDSLNWWNDLIWKEKCLSLFYSNLTLHLWSYLDIGGPRNEYLKVILKFRSDGNPSLSKHSSRNSFITSEGIRPMAVSPSRFFSPMLASLDRNK